MSSQGIDVTVLVVNTFFLSLCKHFVPNEKKFMLLDYI